MKSYSKKISGKYNLGFTLIELLVVVAIIGILSSIVLVSLGGARTRGTVAAIKAEMANLRAQMELDYDLLGGQYECGPSDDATALVNSIGNRGATIGGHKVTGADFTSDNCKEQAWALNVQLPGNSGTWCVDSGGASGSQGATGTTCN
ncbi:MAG TPA: type II secretion system protein [Candidatus Paceibacterota bacterium]|nr:type II secretion system protein [Candidatus Paceibacterota bacterium]